ncbi:dynein regulatory complex subunit 4 isoform X1 [Corythoichthys intestinalis]|uniref:dynein regulatory complex subunit 4 isoform X1 n=1 Tax=Corythoichthys intestinalis TaxID=161448 RepID=UPI0025A67EED|nr:dynein regulatory complex subunit 4 isoform X1 [Corythoichthys intestinalis]
MSPKSQNVSRRKKAVKAKASGEAVDIFSTDEMSKEQLEEHIIRLREELEREREEKSFFQLERDQIQSFWKVSERHLEETQAQLRNRNREKDEADRRHSVEINVYKQKLKHVLSEQHAAVVDKKIDSSSAAWLTRRHHTDAELRLRRHSQNVQADAREKKLNSHKSIQELKLKHQVELMELRNNYDKRISEVEAKYSEKMEQMRRAESEKTAAAISSLEKKMNEHLKLLTEEQHKKFRAAEEFFTATQSKLGDDTRRLKEEASEARKHHARVNGRLEEAEQHNRRLAVSLQESERNLPDLQRQLEEHRRARSEQMDSAARVKKLEEQLEDVLFERDVLITNFAQVEEERDALLSKQMEVLLDVQQRSNLKEIMLDRKMAQLSQSMDRKEAGLLAVTADLQPHQDNVAADRLRDTLESKKDTIRRLQEELDQQCQEYTTLVETCRNGLHELSVPSYDFPLPDAKLVLKTQCPPAALTHW